jgi:hypothetical protein
MQWLKNENLVNFIVILLLLFYYFDIGPKWISQALLFYAALGQSDNKYAKCKQEKMINTLDI